jgi:hypothetical protein
MRINEVIVQDAVMDVEPMGMGMAQYTGEKYGLVGGMRSGSSEAGCTRLRFTIFDIEIAKRDPDDPDVFLGHVDLFVEDGTNKILGLVNIELNRGLKRAGIGSSIVKDIVDTAGGELKIHDVQNKAKGFWKKMGVEYDSKRSNHGVIRAS